MSVSSADLCVDLCVCVCLYELCTEDQHQYFVYVSVFLCVCVSESVCACSETCQTQPESNYLHVVLFCCAASVLQSVFWMTRFRWWKQPVVRHTNGE